MLYLGLYLLLPLLCVIHLFRTGRNPLWLTALIFLPMVGALAYIIVEILPGLQHNRHVRSAQAKASAALNPERELRAAKDALEVADTVANKLRVADALAGLGRYEDAIPYYREAIDRSSGGDARAEARLARALFETGHGLEALATIDARDPPSGQSERDRLWLLRARVVDFLGRKAEALDIYADIVTRIPGEEARCRYAALLIEQGQPAKAREVLEEVEARARRLDRQQRAADAEMYRWAASTLKDLRARA
jgi:hypothetical protein